MTPHDSLLSARLSTPQPRPRSDAETPPPHRRTARFLHAAVCGLLLAAGAPTGAHALSDASAASDTLRITLSAPEGGTVAEGTTGHFEVSVAGSTAAGAVVVQYSIAGTAVAGEDYTALSGEVTVAQGENVARIALEAIEDGILDKGETVVLALTGATASAAALAVEHVATTATIADNGSVEVSLTAVPDTISEGSAWRSTVTMSTPVADRVSVRWWTNDGTAVAGRDYTAANAVVLFEPGETSKPIQVQTLEDDNAEAVEVFYVSLDPPSISTSAAMAGGVSANGDARSAFIQCSVRFPQRGPIVFELTHPVKAGQVVDTVAAETTPGIPYYELEGGDNKFTINSLTAEISTKAALDPVLYKLKVKVHDECGAMASVDVNVNVTRPNRSPERVKKIPDVTIKMGQSGSVDASSYFSDPDDDALTYSASSSDATKVGLSVDGSKVTYEGLKVGTSTITVTATDPGNLSAKQGFEVTVTPRNDPPDTVGAIPADTLEAGQSGSVDASAYFSDPNGDPLTYTATSSKSSVVELSVDGSEVTYEGLSKGSATVTVTATDPGGLFAEQMFAVTVPNRAPTVAKTIPNGTVHVGRTGSVGVSSRFDDPDDDKLTYTATSSHPDTVSVSMNGSNVEYTGESVGGAQVTVRATDPGGLFVEQKFTVTVPNRPPRAVKAIKHQTVHVGKTGSVGVSSNFDDPDGDKLTFKAASLDSTVVGVSVSGSTVEYMGVGVGSAFVSVTAMDPGGLEATQSFVVTVPNRPPTSKGTIRDRTINVGESGSVDVISKFEDPDDDPLTYAVKSSEPTVVGVSVAAGEVTYEGLKAGSAMVTVTATDPGNLSATQSFEVTVVKVNERPTARAGADQWVDEGELVKLDGSGSTDPDGTIDKWQWTGPLKLTNPAAAKASFTAPDVDTTSAYTFTLKVWDDDDATDTDWMKVTVEPVDTTTTCTAPVANAGTARTVREQRRVTLDGSGSRNASSYVWRQVGGRTVTLSNANTRTPWFDTPLVPANEVLTFRLTVTNSCGSRSDDVRVTVRDNRAPEPKGTIPAQPVLKGDSGSVSVSGYFNDPDGDALTYSAASSATGVVRVSASGSTVTYRGIELGSARVTVTARDRYGATSSQRFTVTVSDSPPSNRPPTVKSAIPAQSVVKGASEAVVASPHFSDPDGDALTYTASSSNRSVATVSASNDTVFVRGVSKGTADVTVTARDPSNATVAQKFRVTVSDPPPENRAPRIESAIPAREVETGASEAVVVSPHFSDPDNDALTYTASSANAKVATVTASRDTVLVRGVSKGSAQVTVTAQDPDGESVSQRFEVTVADARTSNRAPVFASGGREFFVAENTPGGTAVGAPVTATDPDGDTVSYSLTSSGDSRRLAIDARTGQLTVAPGAVLDYERIKLLVVQPVASDGELADTITVAFRVTDVPVPGRLGKPAVTGGAGAVTATWEPLADASLGVTGYDLRHRPASATDWTEVSLGLVLTHAAADLEAGTAYLVQVRAVSPEGAGEWSESGGAATAPSFDPASVSRSIPENSASGTAVGAPVTAEAEDGTELTYGFAGTAPALFDIASATGQITVAAGAKLDYESGTTAYAVRVWASDGMLADTAAVTIRVTDVPAPGKPDAPTVAGGMEEVAVTWSAPENEGPKITRYDLRYQARGDSEWTEASSPGAASSRTIRGLKAGTAYQVQVRAVSSEGAGEWSDSGEGATVKANKAPTFDADTYEREVEENSPGGTAVGAPVTATDADGDDLTYSLISGEEEVPFEIDAATGRITVAAGAALDHEGATNSYAARVVTTDGTLADTVSLTIRVTDVPAPGKPDAPVVTGGTEEVAVTWSAPENEGPEITGYELLYQARGDTVWTEASSSGAASSRTIAGLRVGTTYLVQVRAVSSEGAGEWSDSGEGTTAEANEVPAFAADTYEREVAENAAGGTAVGDPVTATDADGDDLTYSLISGEDEVPFEIDSATGQIAVAEGAALDHEGEASSYAVQVVASDGALADTVSLTIRVTDVPAPGKPDAPTVTGGTEEVAVTWSAPENEGPEITGYELRYQARGDSEWTEASSPGAASSRTIAGLRAGTTYLVQVRAVSSEGAGEWSDSGEGTTAEANEAPAFDADAYEREVAENSAGGTAVGKPVTATDADGDDLTYSLISGEDEVPFEIDSATGQIAVAEDAALDHEGEATSYAGQVVASDGALADTASVTIRVTDVPAPGKPDAPVVTGGAEQVAVTWSAPENEGPEITGYDLRYRAKSDSEWTDPARLGVVLAHTITGLAAGTTYLVEVRAVTSEGAGEWSEPGEGMTAKANEAPAFDADAYEREVPENSAGGTAVGDPVTATDADGDDLTYSLISAGDEFPFEIDSATGRITVAEDAALDHEGETNSYAVQVVASDGTLADTASLTIRVTDVPAPGKPDAPVVTGGTEEVAVTWSAPENEGPEITGYDLRYRAQGDSVWTDVSTVGVVLTHTITGLEAGTTYSVQVRAKSSEGAGDWSESGEGATAAANRAPAFAADAYEREVPENSAAGATVGEPVAAEDPDTDDLTYAFVAGGAEALFEIDAATGRIAVAEGAVLNYESPDTLHAVRVEASDGELADTASVTIRVTNADDPGEVALSPEVARVGVELTAVLMDEDGVRSAGRSRTWQRSRDGDSWTDIGTGRMYNPVTADAGRWLRLVFAYADGHGPDKRAASAPVKVLASNATPAFDAETYEREVPENSPGGTRVGKPVKATDGDGDELVYGIVAGGSGALFEIHAATGRIKVAEDAALDYESGDTLLAVRVEASDGELADTASVTIRVTDADDPGKVTLSPEVARVGVELTATLMDEDGVRNTGTRRKWQRSRNGNTWTDIGTGRMYSPVTGDEGRWLRAVFEYTDGHGPDKRAVSGAVKVLPANAAPSFAAVYEREVAENSPGGTKVGAPVAATDPDNASLSYSFASGGDEALFEIVAATGQITVADGAALDYESGDTLLAVRVEASDGELADTASVTIRVTNADDPGKIALSADVARVGVRLTATLMDQDRSIERSKMRSWQRSTDGAAWTMIVQGAERRFYTPTEADKGKFLRAVFTYSDGHGPGKRAESAAVSVVGASTPVVSFGADSYTAAPGGSADVAVLLSPAAPSALAIEVAAGDTTHTVTFQSGASTGTVTVGTAGLSASDTLDVRFGTLPDGVAVGVPATTRIIVAAAAGDRASRSVAEDGSPTELEVEYAHAEYSAVAGGPGTEIALRVSPAADRRVALPLVASHAASPEPMLPDSVVFEPGDSLAAFMLDVPTGTEPGMLALGFGALPEAVTAGSVASATVDIAARDTGALRDEAFDAGLAVLGRAVAEGARQAIGARIDAVMRPDRGGSGTGAPGSATEWAGHAAGTLASLAGLPLGASSPEEMARRSGSLELPALREAAGRLLPRVSFATALGPQSPEGRPRVGLWAEGSAQSFRGEPGINYDGGLRALTVGADARIGSSALIGVSLMRSDGDLDYHNRSVKGSLGHAMNSVHPYLFIQPSPRIGLWAMAGYGSGDVRDDDRHGDTGASLRMLSGGVKVPIARRGAFGLALNGDAFTVGMSAVDGQREGSATRARALLEASWTGGGLKLVTQAGGRYDAGDADTGGGAETGASIGYAAHGLDLDLRGRLALGSGRHREWGAALRLAFDPGARGEGLRLAISPRHGHDRNGIHGLMDGGTLQMMTPIAGRHGQDWRLDAEAGYGLKNPGGGALDSYTRLSADGRNRSWSFGTRYNVSRTLRLGVEGSRRQMPGQHPNLGVKLGLDLTF